MKYFFDNNFCSYDLSFWLFEFGYELPCIAQWNVDTRECTMFPIPFDGIPTTKTPREIFNLGTDVAAPLRSDVLHWIETGYYDYVICKDEDGSVYYQLYGDNNFIQKVGFITRVEATEDLITTFLKLQKI